MKPFLLAALFWLGNPGEPVALPSDTVIIRLAEDEEIKIVSSSGNELEKLRRFDLNQIIRELYRQSEDNAQNTTIILEDSTGTRYLNVADDERDSADQNDEDLAEKVASLERKVEQLETPGDKELSRNEEGETFKTNWKRGTSSTFVFEFGFNNYTRNGNFPSGQEELYAVNPLVSWYVSLGGMNSTHIAGPLSLDWGANVSWYNFKFDNERTRIVKTDGELVSFEDPRLEIEPIKSKIALPYLNIMLVPMFVFGKSTKRDWEPFSYHRDDGFRIGLGAYAGYRLGGRTKYVYREDGNRIRDKNIENFYFNNIRYGARLQMGSGGVDLFFNYDLNELFEDNRGPRLNAFSFGVIL